MEEMFREERQELGGGGFPEELSPFPEPQPSSSVGLLYPEPTTLISPAGGGPQKLRPIRSNGRNMSDASNGGHSSELGLVSSYQYECGGGDMGAGNSKMEWTTTEELVKMKAEMDAHLISNFNSQLSHLYSCFSSSSSSDCSSDDSAHKDKVHKQEPSSNVNPRKKRRKKMESFLQDLMAQLIHKQEQMHQHLMDVFENKERERILREDAWRRQEMQRLHKEQQIRSQEAARSLALISFIRNALGVPEIQVPHLLSPPEEDVGDPHSLDQSDPNNRRWPTSEVQALITLRAALDHKFHTSGAKTPVWEELSAGMAKMGYIRTSNKCKEKWENVNKYYNKATGNGTKHSDNAKSCPYFHELETLYRNRLITAANPNSPTNQHSLPNGKV